MRNSSKKMAVIICVVALVLFFLLRYLLQDKIQVRTAEVVLGDITQGISYSGSIESARRVRISSEIAGRVAEVLFEELDEVVEGQALIKLDDAELKGQLTQAQEALNQAEINLANARKNLHRVKKLFEKGFASREQLDGAEQAVDVGEALVKQHRSNYEVLRTRLNYTTIKAPLSGTVISKNVTAGEIVAGPLAGGGIAMPTVIAEIADLSDLEVHVNVDEIDVAKVVVGQGATIAIDALPDTTFRGVVK
jgi:HlyD family secretion protein